MANRRSRSPDAAFVDACETVGRLLGVTAREDVRLRRQIGVILACVQRESLTYGDRAVERMAESIGVSPHVLYQCARVADAWSSEELEALSTEVNAEGEPLTWSHFVALTRSPSRIARREWTKRCLGASWSVRELRQAMAKGRADEERVRDGVAGEDPGRAVLEEALRLALRVAADLEATLEAVRSQPLIEGEDDELTRRVVQGYEVIASTVGETLECLRGPSESETRLRVADRVSPDVAHEEIVAPGDGRRRT